MRRLTTKEPSAAIFQNPIVEQLWLARQEAKATHASGGGIEANDPFTSISTPRPPSYSRTRVTYPFSSDPVLLENYKSPWGQVRFGKILEDLDAMAGNVAFKHTVSGGSWDPPRIVTAGVDSIKIQDRPSIGTDMELGGQISWVGSSSMEIFMTVACEGRVWCSAKFTFVARDPTSGKATTIVPLLPETNDEKNLFEAGARAAVHKKSLRKMASTTSDYTLEIEQIAKGLINRAAPLKTMPALAPANTMLVNGTEMHNSFLTQPQQTNMHGSIFGGLLMRRAFELSFATAYLFFGSRPKFIEVDDITFQAPVAVGELLTFHSRVLYTLPGGGDLKLDGHNSLAMIEVEAFVMDPEHVDSKLSNKFYFTYSLQSGVDCKTVLPDNLDTAKRMAARMIADRKQAGLE